MARRTRIFVLSVVLALGLALAAYLAAQGRNAAIVQAEPAAPTVAGLRIGLPLTLKDCPLLSLSPTPPTSTPTPTASPTPTATPTPSNTPIVRPTGAFAIATSIYYDLSNPALAYNYAAGDYLLAWESAPAPDGEGAVYVQRLDNVAQPQGSPRLITRRNLWLARPNVTYNPVTNQYLVVWVKTLNADRGEIHRQVFDANAMPQRSSTVLLPSVGFWSQVVAACNPSTGEYYLVWVDGNTLNTGNVHGMMLDANGNASGSLVDLAPGNGPEKNPAVAFNDQRGQFLAAWEDHTQGHEQRKVCYALVDASGEVWGARCADVFSDGPQSNPALPVYSPANDWALLWDDNRLSGDADVWSALVPSMIGPTAITMNLAAQREAALASDEGAQYLAVWQDSRDDPAPPIITHTIYMACLDNLGVPSMQEQPVIANTDNHDQTQPAIAFNNVLGEYLVVWRDASGGAAQIQGMRLAPNCVAAPPVVDSAITAVTTTGSTCPGNTLIFTVTLTNQGGRRATGIVYADTLSADLLLEPGSVQTTAGVVQRGNGSGDADLRVYLPSLRPGQSVTITYRAQIALTLRATQVANNGWLKYNELSVAQQVVHTAPVGQPALQIVVSDAPDPICPGEVITYTAIITNAGNCKATNVDLVATAISNAALTSANPIAHIASLAAGDSRTIQFQAQVSASARPTETVQLDWETTCDQLSPATGAVTTTIGAPSLTATMDDGLPSSASACPGDSLTYTVVMTNTGSCTATNVVFAATLDPNAPLPNGNTSVTYNLGALPSNQSATYQFTVQIADCPPSGVVEVVNQGRVTCAELSGATLTDDPETAVVGDATRTKVSPAICNWFKYDDDNPIKGFEMDPPNVAVVKFNASQPMWIDTVRFWFGQEVRSFRLLVLDSNWNSQHSEDVTPSNLGWFDWDISHDCVQVDGTFYVGIQWIDATDPKLRLGYDDIGQPTGNSYSGLWQEGNGFGMIPDFVDYRIRVCTH